MSPELKAVLSAMAGSNLPLDILARGQIVNAVEVHEALAVVDPDTAEAVCLRALSQYHKHENTEPKRSTEFPA